MSRVVKAVGVWIAVVAVVGWASTALAAPRIKFDHTEVVVKKVKQGKEITVVFPFTNTGDMNLIIGGVSPSCGCTVPSFTPVTKPGGKGQVKLVIDTSDITGAFRKTAVVTTNDPAHPFVTLVVRGETMSIVDVQGGRRITLSGCIGEHITASTTVRQIEGKPLIIAGVDNPMPEYVRVHLKRTGTSTYKLTFELVADTPVEFGGPIFLKLPGYSKVSVWVVGKVRGPFKVRPLELFFGGINPKAPPEAAARSVLVEADCAKQLKLDGIDYDTTKFTLTKHWEVAGKKLLLVITPKPKNIPKGPFEEPLVIRMGDTAVTVKMMGMIY